MLDGGLRMGGFGFVGCFVLRWVWGFGVCFVLVGRKNVGWATRGVARVSDREDSVSYIHLYRSKCRNPNFLLQVFISAALRVCIHG